MAAVHNSELQFDTVFAITSVLIESQNWKTQH